MIINIEYAETAISQDAILKRLTWFRDMSEFYRRIVVYGECGEHEINAFETEKNAFLRSHGLENIY